MKYPNKEYKIVVLGGSCVGKSALINQFVNARFLEDYKPTSSVQDEYTKQCTVDDVSIVLHIVDTGGGSADDYSCERENHFKAADGFMLCFAIDDKRSIYSLKQMQQSVLRVKDADSFPMLLVGTKSDVKDGREVTFEEATSIAGQLLPSGKQYIECSARQRHNVENAFFDMVRLIISSDEAGGKYISSSASESNNNRDSSRSKKCLIM